MGGLLSQLINSGNLLQQASLQVGIANNENATINTLAQGEETQTANTVMADAYIASTAESASGKSSQLLKSGIKDVNDGLQTKTL